MEKPRRLLIIFFLVVASTSFSQKLKKGDRIIAENCQTHVNFLSDDKLKGRVAGSEGEQIADQYIAGQFRKSGCKPKGDGSSWFQQFSIPDGRDIASSALSVNGKPLLLHTDYFPFAFSASKTAEASVAMALAENGVPWFADLKELLEGSGDSLAKDTSGLISEKARKAALKGATALIVYNSSAINDLAFNSMDAVAPASIPVLYVTKAALKKHLSKETSAVDVKLSVEMKERKRNGINVIGYSDNGADSTVITSAHLDDANDVAALLELSRLVKGKPYRTSNYLFVVFPGENKGADGHKYFYDHPVINLQRVNYSLNLDTVQTKGLPAVKQSIASINAVRIHETTTRP
jgi:aminopeptidase YwaD